jgi:hypothetical protein
VSAPAYPTAAADLRVRPSAWWYLAAGALLLAAIGLVVTVVVTGVRLVDDGVSRVPASRVIPVTADGLTVYAAHRPSNRDCTLTARDGQVTNLDTPGYDLNATIRGTLVHAIASAPTGLPPGLYTISCTGVSPQTPLWTGDRIPIWSIILRSVAAAGCLLVGLALLIVLIVMRTLSKNRIKSMRLVAPGGYGGWPGPTWRDDAPRS